MLKLLGTFNLCYKIISLQEQENKQYQDDLTSANLQVRTADNMQSAYNPTIQLQQLKQEVGKLEQSQTSQHQQKASHNLTNLQNLKVQLEEVNSRSCLCSYSS